MENLARGLFWLIVIILPGGFIAGIIGAFIRLQLEKHSVSQNRIKYIVLGSMLAVCILFVLVLAIFVGFAG